MLQLVFGLFEVLYELRSRLFGYEAAVFAEDAGAKPAAGLLGVIVERLQAEVRKMAL